MKEAIGNTIVFQWVIFFIFTLLMVLIVSIMYSRSFKVRNEIITIIEFHQGFNNDARAEINQFLGDIGYRRVAYYAQRGRTLAESCEARIAGEQDRWTWVADTGDDFFYCLYRSDNQNMFRVEVYLHIDLPMLGEFLSFPVRGETKTFVRWDN